MNVQILIAIAQLCHYSVAPAAFGDQYAQSAAWDNKVGQLYCQKYLISCVKSEKDSKKRKSDVLTDCVSNMEYK